MKKAGIAALAGGLALGAGAYCAAARLLTDTPMDRSEPGLTKLLQSLLSGGVPALDAEEAVRAAGALRALPLERVELTAEDGTRLVGHWRGHEHPRRVIVAMHGWRSAWYRDYGASAQFWHDSGCAVLYAEQRSHGESGGEYIGFGLLERFDCLEWARWAVERSGGTLPVYLAGISMGATTVMLAAGLDGLPEQIHGIMADCGFTSMEAILRHVMRRSYHLPYGLFRPLLSRRCQRKIGFTPNAAATTEALRRSTLPLLLIHGEADTFVPPSMSEENYAAAAGPKRLLLVPGARHGVSYLADRSGYENAVLEFWREYDT